MEEFKNPENNIENQIERLLSELDNYALEMFPEEMQDKIADEWYFAEMQAVAGKDREQALKDLQDFIEKLKTTPKI